MVAVLSIQSHVAYGHVGNSSAVFPLQRLGIEVWPVHTVQFSNHTGYGEWTGRVFDGQAIEEVGLTEAIRRYPAQLSGGMKMRVSMARALVTQPRLLLLDEPFAALDEMTRQRLDEQLHLLWSHLGMTVLFVTHSISEAAFLAQRAIVFSKRPARLVADQTLDLPAKRTTELRTQPHFNELVRGLYDMLEREGA